MSERIPVTLITGFLGSGKTTLLNGLLRDPALADTAVIINEFGEIALDHLLVATPAENVVLLANGCICCAVRGELVDTLRDLRRKRDEGIVPRFGRVLIETTGLADPVPVLQTLITDAEIAPLFGLDGVVTLVDAVHGGSQLDSHPEAVKQAALADCLLLTKADLVPERGLDGLKGRLARMNPGAQMLAAVRGRIEASRLLGSGLDEAVRGARFEQWLNAERYGGAGGGHTDEDGHDHRGVASEIRAFCIYLEEPITPSGVVTWLSLLASLRGANLLRVKGLLNVEGKPVVVQAVQTLIDEPVTLERWPDAERRSRLVFITRGMARAEIERTLAALRYTGPREHARGAFDPEAYARFVEAAKSFR